MKSFNMKLHILTLKKIHFLKVHVILKILNGLDYEFEA